MSIPPNLLDHWRRAGEEAYAEGRPRHANPALRSNGRDSPLERAEKRRAWWAGWDAAKARYSISRRAAKFVAAAKGLRH
jgi:hypothetical protein